MRCKRMGYPSPASARRCLIIACTRKERPKGAGAIGTHGTAILLHLLDSPLLSSSFAAVGWCTAFPSFKRDMLIKRLH